MHTVLIPVGRIRSDSENVRLDDGVVIHVGQIRVLDQAMGDIDAKTIDSPIEPEAQDVAKLGADLWIRPVQVGLSAVEQVQVPVVRGCPIIKNQTRPSGTVKDAPPVARRLVGRLPASGANHVAGPRGRSGLAREHLAPPAVIAAGVVGNDVHDDAQSALVTGGDQSIDVGQSAETLIDISVVGDVVAAIAQWRCVER